MDIKLALRSTAAQFDLPKYYVEDLMLDCEAIDKFRGTRLVWLLRTCGTVLVPTQVGAAPVFVTYWLDENHGQAIECFLVDNTGTDDQPIVPVEPERARKAIHALPFDPGSVSGGLLRTKVNNTLKQGCRLGIWGTKTPMDPDAFGGWRNWQRFFAARRNPVMDTFMTQAIEAARETGA